MNELKMNKMKSLDELRKETEGKNNFLEVRAGNTAAIALYSACEFQEIDRRKNYYHDPEEDAVVMKKSVE